MNREEFAKLVEEFFGKLKEMYKDDSLLEYIEEHVCKIKFIEDPQWGTQNIKVSMNYGDYVINLETDDEVMWAYNDTERIKLEIDHGLCQEIIQDVFDIVY